VLWVNLGLMSLTRTLAVGLAVVWRPQIAPVGRVVMTLGLQTATGASGCPGTPSTPVTVRCIRVTATTIRIGTYTSFSAAYAIVA
jgi:hypothetical protein